MSVIGMTTIKTKKAVRRARKLIEGTQTRIGRGGRDLNPLHAIIPLAAGSLYTPRSCAAACRRSGL